MDSCNQVRFLNCLDTTSLLIHAWINFFPRYDRIALYSTFYGRDENKTCQHKVLPSKGHCVAEEHRVNKKLFDLCQGENKCSVAATNAFLGKKNNVICPEVYKYARVVYRCIQHPKIVPVSRFAKHESYQPLFHRQNPLYEERKKVPSFTQKDFLHDLALK